jgi:hypothetical protein
MVWRILACLDPALNPVNLRNTATNRSSPSTFGTIRSAGTMKRIQIGLRPNFQSGARRRPHRGRADRARLTSGIVRRKREIA